MILPYAKRIAAAVAAIVLAAAVGSAQSNEFNRGRTTPVARSGSSFNQNRANNFNEYRERLNGEYIRLTREQWQNFRGMEPAVDPFARETPVAPIRDNGENRRRDDRVIEISEVIRDNGRRQQTPQPVVPFDGGEATGRRVDFRYMGTPMSVLVPGGDLPQLRRLSENDIADAWGLLCDPRFDVTVADCLTLRSRLHLCDWAFLQMINTLANTVYPAGSNEAALLTAYIYSQSGYRMRMAESGGRLELLYASDYLIYNKPYFVVGSEKYYPFINGDVQTLRICQASYPSERSMSLALAETPDLQYSASPQRTIRSERYPQMQVTMACNRNLIDFYNTYPSSEVGGNNMTRWAMYANTPLCPQLRQELYPRIRQLLEGKSKQQAVEMLLNWVQTGFEYKLDDLVWGGDRAFFAEESLFYPYCDCEDRSILFTRLVRELVGLDCLLVYYPGHLAAAVAFPEDVAGDYIVLNGRKFVIADPTYIGAEVGRTMPRMDNATAKVILLRAL